MTKIAGLIACILGLIAAVVLLNAAPPKDVSGMLGKWQGVEGTSLEVQKNGEEYLIIIESLDGTGFYPSKVTRKGISFTRDDVRETIVPGTGAETGMKWLADKKDCVVVKVGEGYCRK